MFNRTPITVVPPGYKPDLDRLPPQGASCRGCVWLLVLVLMVGGGAVGAILVLAPKSHEDILPTIMVTNVPESQVVDPPTVTPTPTVTMDYCWFLTPTLEQLPTVFVTPDVYQLRATDDAFKTGTPTATPYPTQEPPRAWCNDAPSLEASPTFTPFPIPSGLPPLEPVSPSTLTHTPRATATAMPRVVPTSTLFPTLLPRYPSGIQTSGGGSTGGQIQQVIVIQTVVVVDKQVKVKVITATSQPPTATVQPEITEDPTIEDTLTPTAPVISTLNPTSTFTATSTETPTPTATATNTAVPTVTYTHTPTAMPTLTDIPTSTLFPTLPQPEATNEVTNA